MNPEQITIQSAKKVFASLSKQELSRLVLKYQVQSLRQMKNESFYPNIKHLIGLDGRFHEAVEKALYQAVKEKNEITA